MLRIELMGRIRGAGELPAQNLEAIRIVAHGLEVPHMGFGAITADGIDFVAAPAVVSHGHRVPDWNGSMIVWLRGKLWQRADFASARILDLIFFRQFVADTKQEKLAIWYRPTLTDSVIPADAMLPWGNDFYSFLHDLLDGK